MNIFFYILSHNILPIFVLISFGYLLNKKFNLDIFTLSKINFYIFVPLFVLVKLYNTEIHLEMFKVLIYAVLLLILNFIISSILSKIRHYDISMESAFKNSIMFYNSGNIGIPLITLVFSNPPYIINGTTPYLDEAVTAQIMVLVVQNITTNSIGFFNAGRGSMHWKDSIISILKMPTIYAIPTALLLKILPYDMTRFPLWPAFVYAQNGLIPFALITLGIQLSKTTFDIKNIDIYLSCIFRLLGGPLLAFGLIHLLNIKGILAQTLMISASVPTAVNTALIAVEYNNHPDFASQAVITSTLLSSVTLTAVIYLSRILFPL